MGTTIPVSAGEVEVVSENAQLRRKKPNCQITQLSQLSTAGSETIRAERIMMIMMNKMPNCFVFKANTDLKARPKTRPSLSKQSEISA